VLITEIADVELSITAGLFLGNGECDFQLYVSESMVRAFIWYVGEGAGQQIDSSDEWELPVWLQLRVDDRGVLYFEWSQDEITWQQLVSDGFPECGDLTGPMTLLVGSGGFPMAPSVRSFDTFHACAP
jgi:hypothetical protein